MPTPSLPPLTPPAIPSGRVNREEPKKGSNFFFIVMMTLLIIWSLRLLNKPNEQQLQELAGADTQTDEESSQPLESMPLPGEEDSAARLAQLGDDAVAAAAPQKTAFTTLGSADPDSPYRMLVTLSTHGASIRRLELNEDQYRDCSDTSGYLGQIVADESICAKELADGLPGVAVQVVGAGTPVELAGLKVGDRICTAQLKSHRKTAPADEVEVTSFDALRDLLLQSRPGETVTLGVRRAGQTDGDQAMESVDVVLRDAPISLLRPCSAVANYDDYKNLAGLQGGVLPEEDDYDVEGQFEKVSLTRRRNTDPASFLMTLAEYDADTKLPWPKIAPAARRQPASLAAPRQIERELPDLAYSDGQWSEVSGTLRGGDWELIAEESNQSQAVFRKVLLGRKLQVRKVYRLEPTDQEDGVRRYHLTLEIQWRNLDPDAGHTLSYFLDGPTGLPIEGAWYSSGRKTGPGWGVYGLRDMVLGLNQGRALQVIRCSEIVERDKPQSDKVDLTYMGIDTQYFQCTLIPSADGAPWECEYLPMRVGPAVAGLPTFTDTSFRLKSPSISLAKSGSDGDSASHSYTIFAGPKQQKILNAYGLGDTLVYGWFWFIAKPLVAILNFFRNFLHLNCGVAIILLTVMVRLILFPLSRKSALSSMKMQQIQPQLNALKEKYADNPQQMMAAQQALWKKNGVNPLGGCLPVFLQMPIFIGLYKALSLDVNLYGTPLLGRAIRWCSNMAAPDMLVDWSEMWNHIGWNGFNLGQGMLKLGPYFNLLPMLTIILFLAQQKFMMPPPSGTEAEQAQQRSMRRMMNFMMIFFGFMFFKVPSGLCIYFVASSLWAILERKFLPKQKLAPIGDADVIDVTPLPAKEPAAPKGPTSLRRTRADRDGAAAKKPGGLKGWWNEVLERAKEQQKLAKAEAERRSRATGRDPGRKKRR